MTQPMSRALSVVILSIVMASCHDPSHYQPLSATNNNGLNPDSVLKVTPAATTIPADGLSRVLITARIDPASTVRRVAFATTLGTLIAGGQSVASTASLTLDVDANGEASVELKSAAEVATARVTATLTLTNQSSGTPPAFVRSVDIAFSPVRLDELFTLETESSSLPADGFSVATITARILANGDRRQQVTFSASRGTLLQFGSSTANPVVTADATGVARIQVRNDGTVGTSRVTASVLGYQRELFVQFVAINPNDIVTLSADRSQAAADGATLTRLVARVSPNLPIGSREVVFRTTDGEFATNASDNAGREAKVTADASNLAIVDLRSPKTPSTVGVTATVSNVTTRTSIEYVRAQPDTVFVEASKAAVNRVGDTVSLTVYLSRNLGQVTPNTVVTFTARDASGAAIGQFFAVTLADMDLSDSSTFKRLKATATFDPDDAAALGVATITATAGGRAASIEIRVN